MKTLILSIALFSAAFAQNPVPDTSQPLPATTMPGPQDQQPQPDQVVPMAQTPTFKVNVVGRTTPAINYHYRSGATRVDLVGTSLAPKAHGDARVESRLGRIAVDASVRDLPSANSFGREYLTYVLWAITPEGRSRNLGEFVLDGGKNLSVTTDLQAFGLIVTAEPYFAVTTPSDAVVLENQVRRETVGATEPINAKYELIGRGQYLPSDATYATPVPDPAVPRQLTEARNAVEIARLAKADQYAASAYRRAQDLLAQAEGYFTRKHKEEKPIATVSREATQQAEDARRISLTRQEEERAAAERRRLEDERTAAQRQSEEDTRRRADAERQAREDAAGRAEAEKTAAQQRLQAEQAEAARKAAEEERQTALQQQQQAEELARLRSQEAERQRQAAEQAIREKEEFRERLRQQLNQVLETKDSARGLIVNMSDVLFDFNQASLRAGAREKLAKVSGILQLYPDLHLQVEGHTDSIGSDAYNLKLSEKRANSVRDYLLRQGVVPENITAQGLGKSDPVADNKTAAGRQTNRRVEVVVTGESIGRQTIAPTEQPNTNPQRALPQTDQPPKEDPKR